jgi:hypothetical protein
MCREYKPGFTTLIESETFAKGLDETVVRAISAKKREPVRICIFPVPSVHQNIAKYTLPTPQKSVCTD